MTEWADKLARKIHGVAAAKARDVSPPGEKFKVVGADPLVLEQLEGDLVLEEGDPDFEIADAVDNAGVAGMGAEEGDVVLVVTDAAGDYVAVAVVQRGEDG